MISRRRSFRLSTMKPRTPSSQICRRSWLSRRKSWKRTTWMASTRLGTWESTRSRSSSSKGTIMRKATRRTARNCQTRVWTSSGRSRAKSWKHSDRRWKTGKTCRYSTLTMASRRLTRNFSSSWAFIRWTWPLALEPLSKGRKTELCPTKRRYPHWDWSLTSAKSSWNRWN